MASPLPPQRSPAGTGDDTTAPNVKMGIWSKLTGLVAGVALVIAVLVPSTYRDWLIVAALMMLSGILRKTRLWSKRNELGAGVLLAAIVLLPMLHRDWLNLAALVMIGVMYGLGLHIITGMTGMLNLGFVGCAAFGAYLGGWLLKLLVPHFEGGMVSGVWDPHAGLSRETAALLAFGLALAAVIAGSAVLGLVLGYPTLKLSGDYFAIVTLAFSEIILLAIKNLAPITGGTASMRDIPEVHFWPGLDFKNIDIHNHYVIAVAMLILMLAVLGLQFSRFGRALGALRDNRTAAEAAGINPLYYYSMASVISSVVGGIAGFVLAAFYSASALNYSSFLFMESVMVVCYVVIGGLGSFRGAIIGGIGLASATEILRIVFNWWNSNYARDTVEIPQDLRYLIFGLVLILAMRFMPEGLFGKRRGKSATGAIPNAGQDVASSSGGGGELAAAPLPGPWPRDEGRA